MSQTKKLYWICQLAGWGIYSCFYFYVNSVGYIDNLMHALLYCLFITAAGISITHLYRWIAIQRGWLALGLAGICLRVLVSVVFMASLMTIGNLAIERVTFPQFTQDITPMLITRYMGTWLQVFFIHAFIYHGYIFHQKSILAETAKANAELTALTSQINPHFYFNTLNNLYGLAICKSPKTEESILKLSKIMEYVIYDCRSKTVPLSKEIDFIESYLELEKMRYGNELEINFISNIAQSQIEIPPLILITFVENAFKHGAEKIEEHVSIGIHASDTDGLFSFEVKNSARPGGCEGGIGLENVKKRLDLLYPDKYSLEIRQYENEFCVNLSINIT